MHPAGQALGLLHQCRQERLQAVGLCRQLADVAQMRHNVAQRALNPEGHEDGHEDVRTPDYDVGLEGHRNSPYLPAQSHTKPPNPLPCSRVERKRGLRDVAVADLARKVAAAEQERGQQDGGVGIRVLPQRQVRFPAHLRAEWGGKAGRRLAGGQGTRSGQAPCRRHGWAIQASVAAPFQPFQLHSAH